MNAPGLPQYARRQAIGLVVGLVVFVLFLALPAPSGMGEKAWHMAAATALIAVWWVSEAVHPSVTALLPLVLFPLLHILTPQEVSAAYADQVIFLFMGGGPSQVDTWDPKPLLQRLDGQDVPESIGRDVPRIARAPLNNLFASPYRFTHFRKTNGYANHPLDGIWLRAPYLHNGSVPTLRDLLDAPGSRPKVFYRGYDVYDQVKLGFVSDVEAADGQLFSRYDTSVPGNGNMGHEYGTSLPGADKDAIVEYLKTF